MFKLTLTVTIFVFLCAASFAQTPFRSDDDAYQFGYEEGYQHGKTDSDMGLDFNATHSHRFRSGITYFSYNDSNFRSGYTAGYSDGFEMDRVDRDFDDDRLHVLGTNTGFVTVFTNRSFDGTSRAFAPGQYPVLNGRLRESIDSVEMHGPVRVILFSEPNFQGQRLILEDSTSELDQFNFGDRAESMIIEQN